MEKQAGDAGKVVKTWRKKVRRRISIASPTHHADGSVKILDRRHIFIDFIVRKLNDQVGGTIITLPNLKTSNLCTTENKQNKENNLQNQENLSLLVNYNESSRKSNSISELSKIHSTSIRSASHMPKFRTESTLSDFLHYKTKFIESDGELTVKRVGFRRWDIEELSAYPNFQAISSIFVQKEIIKKKLPPIEKNDTTTIWKRELYDKSLAPYERLKRIILSDINILPREQQDEVLFFLSEQNQGKNANKSGLLGATDNLVENDLFFHNSIRGMCNSVFKQASVDFPQFGSFYLNLFEEQFKLFSQDVINCLSPEINSIDKFKIKLQKIEKMLLPWLETPGGQQHEVLIKFIARVNLSDEAIIKYFCKKINLWLQIILLCLYSPYESVRQNSSCVLCFLATQYIVMQKLVNSINMVNYISMILKCIDFYPDCFELYLSVVLFYFNYCPHYFLLESLNVRAHKIRHQVFQSKWPLLVYYACEFWPSSAFPEKDSANPLYHLLVLLERNFSIQKSKKNLKYAITALAKRIVTLPLLITVYKKSSKRN